MSTVKIDTTDMIENASALSEIVELFLRHKQIYVETLALLLADGSNCYVSTVYSVSDEFDQIAHKGIIGKSEQLDTFKHETIADVREYHASLFYNEEIYA